MRIGWIGTGLMGQAMCRHLLAAGHQATVFNRTKAKAQPLLDAGAAWAETPRAVAVRSDVVFTMVGMPSDVREVILGPDGALGGLDRGSYLVDMSTSDPALAAEIHRLARERGVQALDAPVSGGEGGAKAAALSIMVGGESAAVETMRPLFRHMGTTIVHQGGPGFGQRAKLVNQILIATNMIAVCEGLLFAVKAGLDLDRVLESVAVGAAGSRMLAGIGESLKTRDWAPGFYVEHFLKDMGLALGEAKRLRLALPGLALAHQLYLALEAQGHGRKGTQALLLVLEGLSGMDRDGR